MFFALGPTLAARCLLAVAVGALTGLLVRRAMVAMSVAGLATGAVMAVMIAPWERLWAPAPAISDDPDSMQFAPGEFILDSGPLTASGERLCDSVCFTPQYAACYTEHESSAGGGSTIPPRTCGRSSSSRPASSWRSPPPLHTRRSGSSAAVKPDRAA